MSYTPNLPDYIAFSTTTLLTNGQTYDSGIISLVGYTQVQTDVLSNKNGNIVIDFCTDLAGSDIARTLTIPYVGGSGYQMFSAPAFTPYVRYRFTVTETGQSDFYFDTKLLTKALSPQILRLDAYINDAMSATVGRSIVTGKTEGSYWSSVGISNLGSLDVNINEPQSAFGEILTVEPTPVVQTDFVYGLNGRLVSSNVVGSGVVSAANGLANVSTSSVSNSTATLFTNRYIKYKPGQGAVGKFTALFTTGTTGTKQYAGLATPTLSDGFMFGYNGETFGIWTIKDNVETHIPQTTWNTDVMSGVGGATNPSGVTLDPTKGNVYSIQYQYLGFGKIEFFIESPNGNFVLVHIIKYANNNTLPSLGQPSLNLVLHANNASQSTEVSVKSGSMAGFVQGQKYFLGPRWGISNNRTGITSETNIVTLKNCSSFNGVINRALLRIRNITFGSNAGGAPSGITTLRLILNATLTTPSYVAISGSTGDGGNTITGNSATSYDTTGTGPTGGTVIYNEIISVQSSQSADVTDLDIYMRPGDTLTFEVSSTQSATVGVGIVWNEDI